MIYEIEKDTQVPNNSNLFTLSSGSFDENELVECYNIEISNTQPYVAFSAKYISTGQP